MPDADDDLGTERAHEWSSKGKGERRTAHPEAQWFSGCSGKPAPPAVFSASALAAASVIASRSNAPYVVCMAGIKDRQSDMRSPFGNPCFQRSNNRLAAL